MNRFLVAASVVILTFVCAWRPEAAHAAGKPEVAVLGLEVVDDGSGLDAQVLAHAKELTEALRRRPKSGTGPYTLAPGSDRDLSELKFIRNCEGESADCMAAIGTELGVAFLLYGKVEKVSGGLQVSLTLFTVGSKQAKTTSEKIPTADTTSTELERWSKAMYAKLTGGSVATVIAVNANVRVGKVLVDGVAKADLVDGTARLTGITNGRREIAIDSAGFILGTQVVTVKTGSDLDLHFTLTRAGDEITGPGDTFTGPGGQPPGGGGGPVDDGGRPGGGYRAAFWGASVVTVASAATWVYGYTQRNAVIDTLDQRAEDQNRLWDCDDARDAADCDEGQKWATVTYFAVPLTFIAGALAGYSFYKGYVAAKRTPTDSQASRSKRRGAEVVVIPTISPEAAGATVRIDF